MALRFTAEMESGLEIVFRVFHRSLSNGARVLNRMTKGRLAVDVFAGLKGIDYDLLMFMRCSGNDDSLYVLVFQ